MPGVKNYISFCRAELLNCDTISSTLVEVTSDRIMRISERLRKPSNWQDFEKLCLLLWRAEWGSEDLKLNGRLGQRQNGVDICGHRYGQDRICGIQCKCKNEGESLSKEEIRAEIEKAKSFRPALAHLILATTAEKDVEIEEYVRLLDEKNRKNGVFSVDIKSWEDIVFLLEIHPQVLNYYLGIIDDDYDVKVCFINDKDVLDAQVDYIKVPNLDAYYKYLDNKRQEYSYSTLQYGLRERVLYEINCSYFEVKIVLHNIGQSPLDNYKLVFSFDQPVILTNRVSRRYSTSCMTGDLEPLFGVSIDKEKVVYESRDCLVSGDTVEIPSFYVKGLLGTTELQLNWKLLSRGFKTSGVLTILLTEIVHSVSTESCPIPQDNWEIAEVILQKEG